MKGCFLYRLLRPELVKNNRVALSSDAFSRFPVEEGHFHNEEVSQASKHLEEVLTRQVAVFLGEHYSSQFARMEAQIKGQSQQGPSDADRSGIGALSREEQREEFHRLVNHIHRQGVNVRWLGVIHSIVRQSYPVVGHFLLTEIVARTAKNILRAQMRRLRCPEDEPYVLSVVRYFNLLFSPSHRSQAYWNHHLAEGIHRRFPHAVENSPSPSLVADDTPSSPSLPSLPPLSSSSASALSVNVPVLGPPVDLRRGVHMVALFHRLQDILGIKFCASADRFTHSTSGLVLLGSPFQPQDVLEIFPVVKYIHRISFEEGTALSLQAAKQGGQHSDAYFNIANEKYSDGLRIKPGDYRALHNWVSRRFISVVVARYVLSPSRKVPPNMSHFCRASLCRFKL